MKLADRGYLEAQMIVRIARVSQVGEELGALESWLSIGERERAARFHFREDRVRFVLGRGLLRKCLGPFLLQAPEAIELTLTAQGQPFLSFEATLHFSISHTHDLVAVALTAGARIGVDLEWIEEKSDLAELARRILSEADYAAFEALPEGEKVAAFFRVWTRKEAYLKARGEGIAEGLELVSISAGPESTSTIKDARDEGDARARDWRLWALPVPPDYMGCVACDDASKRLDCEFVRFDGGEMIGDARTGLGGT